MKTINCTDWEVVTHEGIDQNEPPRKKKKPTFLLCTVKIVAFLVIVALAGNLIEFLARL